MNFFYFSARLFEKNRNIKGRKRGQTMTQPTLNEYFTLTNDLLFKLIVSSVPHSMNKDVESTMVFSIDSETMNSADSIGVGLQVGDFMTLGVQTVTAWRSAHLRDKGSGQRAAWRTIPRHERNRGRAAGRRRFLCPESRITANLENTADSALIGFRIVYAV